MIDQEMAHRGLGAVDESFAGLPQGGRVFSLLLAAHEVKRSALALAQEEEAAIEAQDVLSQADEALVMG